MPRLIAFYLPQFHLVAENDEWWGKGFTEWTNTAKAKPLFGGHYQPHVPADLGFYDLRVPETRQKQADLARSYGIEGFCYYDYWFAGRRILERPLDEVVASRAPDYPFCVCWANESWTGIWHGTPGRMLIEQTYPGEADHKAHFDRLRPAFTDPRYIRVEGKPLFAVYKPHEVADTTATLALWRRMAEQAGLGGLYIVGYETTVAGPALIAMGYDAVIKPPLIRQRSWTSKRQPKRWLLEKIRVRRGLPTIEEFAEWAERNMSAAVAGYDSYPCVVHAWDNTPRSGARGVVFRNPEPAVFARLLRAALGTVADKPDDKQIVFLKSWNEWAEGNHLEPDLRYGHAYLKVIAEAARAVS